MVEQATILVVVVVVVVDLMVTDVEIQRQQFDITKFDHEKIFQRVHCTNPFADVRLFVETCRQFPSTAKHLRRRQHLTTVDRKYVINPNDQIYQLALENQMLFHVNSIQQIVGRRKSNHTLVFTYHPVDETLLTDVPYGVTFQYRVIGRLVADDAAYNFNQAFCQIRQLSIVKASQIAQKRPSTFIFRQQIVHITPFTGIIVNQERREHLVRLHKVEIQKARCFVDKVNDGRTDRYGTQRFKIRVDVRGTPLVKVETASKKRVVLAQQHAEHFLFHRFQRHQYRPEVLRGTNFYLCHLEIN
ncbi:hypothetical protein T12_4135 [Trichinella patagoniensis]|uniref:Uncharacterized protein n=1 Tax=Trichinella patagoniensis TaxID=990121 RepID=A0A0V1A9N7_9BILA|nr:hypothetical protein T12_4135 [Trichinella patagoniensis]